MSRGCLILSALPLAALAVVLFVAVWLALNWQDAPDRDEVAATMILGGELVAYEVVDGVPYVVFVKSAGSGTVIIDRLFPDLIERRWPPAPAWQLTGNWYGIRRSSDPASIGVSRCTGQLPGVSVPDNWYGCDDTTQLFGEITDERIVWFEADYGGEWHRFAVSAPGYVVSLARFDGVPDRYRWLDATGSTIWERDAVPELLWR